MSESEVEEPTKEGAEKSRIGREAQGSRSRGCAHANYSLLSAQQALQVILKTTTGLSDAKIPLSTVSHFHFQREFYF